MPTRVSESGYHENAALINSFTGWLHRHQIAQESARAYVADVRRFLRFAEPLITHQGPTAFEHLEDINVSEYRARLVDSGLQPSTVKRNLMAIRKFFDFLIQQRLVASNPVAAITPLYIPGDSIPTEKILEMFGYLQAHQIGDGPDSIRYRRDELILICLVLFGIRFYQIPGLRPSAITQTGNAMCLRVSSKVIVELHIAFLVKLRAYLNLRQSRADVLFLEPGTKKPVTSKSLHALLIELNCAIHVSSTPPSLFHTFQRLQNCHEDTRRIWQSLAPVSKVPGMQEGNNSTDQPSR